MCDLSAPAQAAALVAAVRPEVVINAQALSDVDACEQDPAAAEAGNVQTVRVLTAALQSSGALLVHLSTDYVFDGEKGAPYVETDPPRPLSVYGRSKWAGEQVALAYARGVVVRTSTLFGPGRHNFCDYIVRQVRAGQPVDAFADQVTSPTYTRDLAAALEVLTARLAPAAALPVRLFHAVNEGQASRVAFARRIAERVGAPPDLVCPIRRADQRRPAARPAFSALASLYLSTTIGRRLPTWDDALLSYLHLARWAN